MAARADARGVRAPRARAPVAPASFLEPRGSFRVRVSPRGRVVRRTTADVPDAVSTDAPLRVLVAGGGLGGLFAAICLRNAGADVVVLERTARYRPFGGPIQLASNGVGVIGHLESLFRRVHA